jgi:hypothetical protein
VEAESGKDTSKGKKRLRRTKRGTWGERHFDYPGTVHSLVTRASRPRAR